MRIPRRAPHPDDLRSQSSFDEVDHFSAALAEPHNDRCWFFTIVPTIAFTFLKAILIGFGQSAPLATLIIIFLLEIVQLALTIWLKPGLNRRSDIFTTSLSGVKVVSVAMLFAFVPSAGVKPIPRVIVAIAIAFILSATIVLLFFNTLFNAIPWTALQDMFKRHSRRNGRWSVEIQSSGGSREVVGTAAEGGDLEKNGSAQRIGGVPPKDDTSSPKDRFTIPVSLEKLRNKIRRQKRSISSTSGEKTLSSASTSAQPPLDRHSRAAAVMNGDDVDIHRNGGRSSRSVSMHGDDSESVISYETRSYATWSPTSPANWPPPVSPSVSNYGSTPASPHGVDFNFSFQPRTPQSFSFGAPVSMGMVISHPNEAIHPMQTVLPQVPMPAPVLAEQNKGTAISTPTDLALGRNASKLPVPNRTLYRMSNPPISPEQNQEQEQERGGSVASPTSASSYETVRPRSLDL
jgi:hypothetical protein